MVPRLASRGATPRRQRTQRRAKDQAKRTWGGAASGGGGGERLRSSGMPWVIPEKKEIGENNQWF